MGVFDNWLGADGAAAAGRRSRGPAHAATEILCHRLRVAVLQHHKLDMPGGANLRALQDGPGGDQLGAFVVDYLHDARNPAHIAYLVAARSESKRLQMPVLHETPPAVSRTL